MLRRLLDEQGQYVIRNQGSSFNLEVTLKDADGATVDAATVSTLTLTLFDRESATIINSRNAMNVQNANGGTISASILTVRLDAADNAFVDDAGTAATGDIEEHIARIIFTWSDGQTTRTGLNEVMFGIRKIASPA